MEERENELQSLYVPPDEYNVSYSDFLGRGQFGFVYRCYDASGIPAAVKLFSVHGSRDYIEDVFSGMVKEAKILITMDKSPHVIKLLSWTWQHHWMGIVMEYAPRGTMRDLISKRTVPWSLRLRLMYETAAGLSHLHGVRFNERITHNDLKPDNILITENFHAKICDFGGSNMAAYTSQMTSTTPRQLCNVHTPNYTAPEFHTSGGRSRTRAMDVFSYGMITYFVLTRKDPFENKESQFVTYNIGKGTLPVFEESKVTCLNDGDRAIVAFLNGKMKNCQKFEPNQRPNMKQIKDDCKEKLIGLEDDIQDIVSSLAESITSSKSSAIEKRMKLSSLCTSIFVSKLEIPFDREESQSDRVIPDVSVKATCSTVAMPEKSATVKEVKTIDLSHMDINFNDGDEINIITKRRSHTASITGTWQKQ